MAVVSSTLVGLTAASLDKDGRDTFTRRYLVVYDAIQSDPYTAVAAAQLATSLPNPVPKLRSQFSTTPVKQAYCKTITPTMTSENRLHYWVDCSFSVPEPNQQNPGAQDPNPLLRPGKRNIEYIASEYVVKEAKNVEALMHGGGYGLARPANALGPIVNAAGKRPDEPIVDTEYNGVLVWEQNFATLNAIDVLNQTYQRTTNSNPVLGYDSRRLKYLVTESLGEQYENDIVFYTGQTRVEIKKTTDLILDNVGYEYWDRDEDDFAPALDKDGGRMSEPIFLDLAGYKESNATTITYRHLKEVDYASLFGVIPAR